MNTSATNQSSPRIVIPSRRAPIGDRELAVPARDIAHTSRSVAPQRFISSMMIKSASQSALPLILPMPPELPPAMTPLLPLSVDFTAHFYSAK